MVCYHPKRAWQLKSINPVTGKRFKPVFKMPIDMEIQRVARYEQAVLDGTDITYQQPVYEILDDYEEIMVPCGKCLGCLKDRSRQWAVRCVHEASLYDENCFITLTFDDEHLNPFLSLNKKDYVDFMKRLRFRFGEGIRFFHCGEYGDLRLRPHHHAIIFNFDFPDKELFQIKGGVRLYRSAELERLWPFGFSTIGAVSFESAAYVARYVLKKINVTDKKKYYAGRVEPYITMSRRPGIANEWFQRFYKDVYPHDYVVINNGMKLRPPRYYDKLYDLRYPDIFQQIKDARKERALEHEEENTPDRLSVRERIAQLKQQQFTRNID